MSIPGTVQITGQLAPTDVSDTFPTHADIYGLGGLRVVADHTARNAVTVDRSSLYMVVVTQNDGFLWQLTTYPPTGVDGDWTQFTGGGGFSNPMTTAGDLIVGGVAGAPGRLGIGTEGTVLTVSGGAEIWSANPAVEPAQHTLLGGI